MVGLGNSINKFRSGGDLLVFEAGGAEFGEESLGGDAEFFGGAGFVPGAFAESVFEQDFFDVGDGAVGDSSSEPSQLKDWGQHASGQFGGVGLGRGQLQVLGADADAVGEDDGALESVLKFADVAGPAIVSEAFAGFGGESQAGLVEFAAEFFQEMVGEKYGCRCRGSRSGGMVSGTAEMRKNRSSRKSFSSASFCRSRLVAATMRTSTSMDCVPPTRSKRRSSRTRRSLAWIGQRQLADFVEEERAVVGEIHLADFAGAGSGEGAALVAEEFVFDQAFGDGGAVQCDEGLLAARREMVDGAREEFLAGAAFAEEQNGGVGGGDFLNLLAEFADGGVFAEDAREAVARGIFFAEDEIFAQQFLLAGGAADEEISDGRGRRASEGNRRRLLSWR